MADWFAATGRSLKAGFRQTGLTWFAVTALFCAALLLRLPGYNGRPLWIDELWRANLILNPAFWHNYFFSHSVESAITSLGYACIIKVLALFQVSPDILRLSSLIPGVLAVMVAFLITRKAGGSVAVALAASIVFALNSNFINYSKEMKPYMFEVLVHMTALYAWLAVLQTQRPTMRTWLMYGLVLLLAVLSTVTAVFLLPASGLTLFIRFWADADKEVRNRNLVICIAIFAAIGLVVVSLYYFIWRYGADGGMLSIWAAGFFHSGTYVRFVFSALLEMWREAFDTVVGVPREAELALALAVATLLWGFVSRKALEPPTLYVLFSYSVLVITACLVNFANIWPLGASRVNLFLYAYLAIFLFLLAARLPFSDLAARLGLVGACFVLLWHAHSPASRAASRTYYHNVVDLLRKWGAPVERSDLVIEDFSVGGSIGNAILADCPSQKTVVVADSAMSSAVNYYTKYDTVHQQGAALLKGSCVRYQTYTTPLRQADMDLVLSKLLPGVSHAWFIYSHREKDEVDFFYVLWGVMVASRL